MARKTRRKSAVKVKKKHTASKTAKRKAAAKKRSKPARKKTAPKTSSKTKPKGILTEITGGFEAVIDTLTEAERLHRKLEPRPALDREPE